jgi:arylsulfatase A-like enzyme
VRRTAPVSLIDLVPTLKDLLGLEWHSNMQGESFAPVLFNGGGDDRTVYFTDVREHDQMYGLLENGFKLIALGHDEFELYDLGNDPGETKNIAAERPEIVASMHHKIKAQNEANELRKIRNTAEPGDSVKQLSDEELKKLRALGYVK